MEQRTQRASNPEGAVEVRIGTDDIKETVVFAERPKGYCPKQSHQHLFRINVE